jgi:hypothetical protein
LLDILKQKNLHPFIINEFEIWLKKIDDCDRLQFILLNDDWIFTRLETHKQKNKFK